MSKLVMNLLSCLMLTLFLLPTSSAQVSSVSPHTSIISGVRSHHMANVRSHHMANNCQQHFGPRLQVCLQSFLPRMELFDITDGHLQNTITVHICLEYQLVLLCLHSALTDCHTLHNLRRVQSTLDSHWAVKANSLCSIPARASTRIAVTSKKDHTNFLGMKNLPQKVIQPSEDFIKNLHENSAYNFHSDILTPKDEEAPSDSLISSNPTLPKLERTESSSVAQSSTDGPREVHPNIYNFVNNYQHDKSRVQQDKERSRPAFQSMFEKSSGCTVTGSLLFIVSILMTVALQGVICR